MYYSPEQEPESSRIEQLRSEIKESISSLNPENLPLVKTVGEFARKSTAATTCLKGLVERTSGNLLAIMPMEPSRDEPVHDLPANGLEAELTVNIDPSSARKNFAICSIDCPGLAAAALRRLHSLAGEINQREDESV